MSNTFKPRQYQTDISNDAALILNDLGMVIFSVAVRVGKTFISLMTANKINAKSVLFITKKKAIPSIQSDYDALNPAFDIIIINYESLHKLPHNDFDLIICDESHTLSAFPKPSKRTKQLKVIAKGKKVILMSGTLHPESYSQIFHQFWVSDYSPFKDVNFYKWAKSYVDVQKKQLGYAIVNDYSKAYMDKIEPIIKPYIISFTQKDAGFKTEIRETVLTVPMDPKTYKLANKLKKDRVIQGKEEVILSDTAVKLQQKLHQIYSGTVKFESGNSMVIDTSKAEFIKDTFKGKRIAIFYKFKAELIALKSVFDLTDNVEAFNNYEFDVIALQFLSGREGISLKTADYIIYYNIDFSAVTYFQSRDRLTTMERKNNEVFWIFSQNGIEQKIYNSVIAKKDYTLRAFKKDYKIR